MGEVTSFDIATLTNKTFTKLLIMKREYCSGGVTGFDTVTLLPNPLAPCLMNAHPCKLAIFFFLLNTTHMSSSYDLCDRLSFFTVICVMSSAVRYKRDWLTLPCFCPANVVCKLTLVFCALLIMKFWMFMVRDRRPPNEVPTKQKWKI